MYFIFLSNAPPPPKKTKTNKWLLFHTRPFSLRLGGCVILNSHSANVLHLCSASLVIHFHARKIGSSKVRRSAAPLQSRSAFLQRLWACLTFSRVTNQYRFSYLSYLCSEGEMARFGENVTSVHACAHKLDAPPPPPPPPMAEPSKRSRTLNLISHAPDLKLHDVLAQTCLPTTAGEAHHVGDEDHSRMHVLVQKRTETGFCGRFIGPDISKWRKKFWRPFFLCCFPGFPILFSSFSCKPFKTHPVSPLESLSVPP